MNLAGVFLAAILTTSAVDENLHHNEPAEASSSEANEALDSQKLSKVEAPTEVAQGVTVVTSRLVPPEYPLQRPCQNQSNEAEENQKSDLCAQWTAAQAAADTVGYAWWQNLISIIGAILSFAGVILIIWSLRIAGKATRHAGDAVKAAFGGLELAKAEFEERMRPKCSIVAIKLDDQWIDALRGGSDFPMTIIVENLGGATARNVDITIKNFRILDRNGVVLMDQPQIISIPPVRVEEPRHIKTLVRAQPGWPTAHSIEIVGVIGSHGDMIEAVGKNLSTAEDFYWIDDEFNRGSVELIER